MMAEATIFIVDDDEAVRDSLKLLLETYDFEVADCASIGEFLRAYRPRRRQCLVVDLHLPGETGLEFLESIGGSNLRIPVILVSGGDRSVKERAAKAGVLACLDKPLDNSVLLATIFQAIGIARKDRPH